MAATTHHQLSLPPALVQSASQPRETPCTPQVKELSLTALLAEAVASTGCSEKDAAISQGYEPAYWSRVKAGEKAAHLERIARLPERVQREFVTRWAHQLRMRVSDEGSKIQALAEFMEVAARTMREIA